MSTATAILASNYTISGGVVVNSVTQISPTTYMLNTSNELAGTTYTVTPSINIVDLLGNPVS